MINEIKKDIDLSKTVVHCTTQKEWDYVINRITNIHPAIKSSTFKHYEYKSCIYIIKGTYGDINFVTDCTILSFSEWCKQFNHKPEFMKTEEKQLTVDDLVEGEVYYYEDKDNDSWIFKSGGKYNHLEKVENNKIFHKNKHTFGFTRIKTLRFATPEEKQWLEACIKANKFIPKEEALKVVEESIPEYVECINEVGWNNLYKLNQIYNTSIKKGNQTWEYNLKTFKDFKPSTKEAFLEMLEKELKNLLLID